MLVPQNQHLNPGIQGSCIPCKKYIIAPQLLFFCGGCDGAVVYIIIYKGGGCGVVAEILLFEQCERRSGSLRNEWSESLSSTS